MLSHQITTAKKMIWWIQNSLRRHDVDIMCVMMAINPDKATKPATATCIELLCESPKTMASTDHKVIPDSHKIRINDIKKRPILFAIKRLGLDCLIFRINK